MRTARRSSSVAADAGTSPLQVGRLEAGDLPLMHPPTSQPEYNPRESHQRTRNSILVQLSHGIGVLIDPVRQVRRDGVASRVVLQAHAPVCRHLRHTCSSAPSLSCLLFSSQFNHSPLNAFIVLTDHLCSCTFVAF